MASSPPWFSAIFSGNRQNNSRLFIVEEPFAPENKKSRPITDRGMSPVRMANSDNEWNPSPSASGYSSEAREGRDVVVLSDLAAPYGGHGDFHAQVFRRPGGPSLRSLHHRIHLVLLPLHHHPRPR
ncbi:hypothetical protein FH972_025765 [Carpinus fangiana]|uniref:Uncharacterized protein n=1 Tax=Carpinus fangiana TaxID=176857 RepID=A0A5N6L1Z2_9ROSI|nr:hypothetical protein FH972_025765 [Carpinus fangiana]